MSNCKTLTTQIDGAIRESSETGSVTASNFSARLRTLSVRDGVRDLLRAGVRPLSALTASSAILMGALSATAAPPASARSIIHPLDIPAQSLDEALKQLSTSANEQLLFSKDLVEGKRSAPVKGTFTTDQALEILLKDSGLVVDRTPSGVLLIRSEEVSKNTQRISQVPDAPVSSAFAEDARKDANFWSRLRLAQVDQGVASSSTPSGGSAESREPTLAEVVVTAQKRVENLQDIPISISAIGGQRIEELGLQSLNDLMGQVPGVSFSSVGPGEGNLVIRGIAATDIINSVNNRKEAVGVYIDDTPVGQVRYNPDISPFDLERVEVLRGPQGTLYGSGSLAGTVRYITSKPSMQELQTKVGADLSSTKRGGINHRLDAMANVPLSDTFALRVVGYQQFDDGYIRGVGPAHLGHDENDVELYGGRMAVRWEPTERFTADASAMLQRLDGDMSAQDNEGATLSRGIPVGPYEQYRDSKAFTRNRFNLYNLTLDYDLGWGNLTSSTSLVENEIDNAEDFTAVIDLYFGVDLVSRGFTFSNSKDLNQELRIATSFDGPLNLVGGVFYTDQHREQYQSNPTPGFDAALGVDSTAFGADVDNVFMQTVDIDERQVALFGELTYEMTEKLSATLGLRWFDVEQDYYIATAGIATLGNPPLNRTSGESDFNPKFLVSYAASDDVLISAQAARGFRLGGTNELVPDLFCGSDLAALGLTRAPESFQSENVWNYELNAKTSWLDRRLTVNGSVYHIDYKDIQVVTPLECSFSFTDNAGSARSRGVELELTARPLDRLELSIGGAYTDAELTVDVPQLGGRNGDQLPMSARFTGNANARYEFPIGGTMDGFVQYSYRYTDEIPLSLNFAINPDTEARPAPAYDLHNLRLGLKTGRWNASVYLNNVLDEKVITYERNYYSVERLRTRGQPRTVGLNVSANF